MRKHVRFILGDDLVQIGPVDPTRTVLDWLRLDRGLVGTKEGCAEGDCGACTVAVGRLESGRVRYEAVNSCIRLLPTLDGCHVVAIEHLKHDDRLHPVQAAMIDRHAAQCGFCTPGIVMSLACLLANEPDPTGDRVDDALAGNLCRCTGYRPIVEAALQASHEAASLPAALGGADIAERLADLVDGELLSVGDGERRFFAPASLDQLRAVLADDPDAILVAGATDVGLWVAKEMRVLDPIVHLGRVAALRVIADCGDRLEIGAAVTHVEARPHLARLHPHLDELLRRFGGEQIRNCGTLGGNLATGSPIGDLAPSLIALDATIVLDGPGGERAMPLEQFFLGYRRQDRAAGEFVARVDVPKLGPEHRFHVSKVSKRFDEDISTVCGAFRLTLDGNGRIAAARLVFGGMAATPKRAAMAEASLLGWTWDGATVERAASALADDFEPIDDWRASARYRRLVAANLLRRFLVETTEPDVQTRVAGLLAAPDLRSRRDPVHA